MRTSHRSHNLKERDQAEFILEIEEVNLMKLPGLYIFLLTFQENH